jgi:hypothetical protein
MFRCCWGRLGIRRTVGAEWDISHTQIRHLEWTTVPKAIKAAEKGTRTTHLTRTISETVCRQRVEALHDRRFSQKFLVSTLSYWRQAGTVLVPLLISYASDRHGK